jgi:4-coumarate--CoA ligase
MVSATLLTSSRVQSYINTWLSHGIHNRTLAHLPTAHIAGLQNYFVQCFHQGATTYWMPGFNFDLFLRHCADLGIAQFFTVPPIYMGIAKHPAVKDQFGNMMLAVTGAAPLSAELQSQAGAKLNGVFIGQTWGLTETTGSATLVAPDKKGSPGSLSGLLPNVLLR